MQLKKNKKVRNCCVHYEIEKVKPAQLNKDDIASMGKIQYDLKIQYFEYRGNMISDSNFMRIKKIRISGNRMVGKLNAIERNIGETKRDFIVALLRNGVTEQSLTYILAIKGFGHDAR